jgi:predicted nucleotidyltransferase component of viral defense system
MGLSETDYKKLYKLQDKVFKVLKGNLGDFYLTGGTALGRFYLNHRYSDDLDFFVNAHPEFLNEVKRIHAVLKENFEIVKELTFETPTFYRIWIEGEPRLKVEFVNDVKYHTGEVKLTNGVYIDNPKSILSNKLTAILSRDEAKDVFDIVSIALKYSFNWKDIYYEALEKQLVNESTIAWRLSTFPIPLLSSVIWAKNPIDLKMFEENLKVLSDDFLFAQDNSLGKGKPDIDEAEPVDLQI